MMGSDLERDIPVDTLQLLMRQASVFDRIYRIYRIGLYPVNLVRNFLFK